MSNAFNPITVSSDFNIDLERIIEVEYTYIVLHKKKIDDFHHSSEVVACFDSEEKAIDFVTESNYYDRNVKGFDWFDFVTVEVN